MVTDFFDWYYKRLDEFDADPIYVWQNGKRQFDQIRKNAGIIYSDGMHYIFKLPHSRYYKNHRKEFAQLSYLATKKDSTLSLTSELISEKKYKAAGFLCAKHFIIKQARDYYLISPNLLHGYVDYKTYSEILRDPYDDVPFQSRVLNRLTSKSLRSVLKNKRRYLKIMTEECYDEYVKYLLSSVFEFSDDEHYNNVILCRNHGSDKFESLFLFDKESNVFNPLIAQGMKFNEVQYYSLIYEKYVGRYIYTPGETINERISEIGMLIKKGLLPQKYIDFINQVANFDFAEAAKQVYEETGIKADQIQVDMYKYGSELAGQILSK